ncbi:hypothetical protein SFR_4789 [Streptomyces sp. FR-008]|nr:hypothetical protein SFR_4789 [Streptomyces sp. FR-008]
MVRPAQPPAAPAGLGPARGARRLRRRCLLGPAPHTGLWLPAGVVHRTGATRDAVLCSLYAALSRTHAPSG